MVEPLDWLATVSQPFIVALLGVGGWYARKAVKTMNEIQDENRFFRKAIQGDDSLGYPGLMDRTNKMKDNVNQLSQNQQQIADELQEYGITGDIDPPGEINGPDPKVEEFSNERFN